MSGARILLPMSLYKQVISEAEKLVLTCSGDHCALKPGACLPQFRDSSMPAGSGDPRTCEAE